MLAHRAQKLSSRALKSLPGANAEAEISGCRLLGWTTSIPRERPKDWVDSGEAIASGPEEDAAPAGEQPFPRGAQRYKVEFTAKDEYVSLLNQARDLLARADSGRSLEAIHLRAMRLLVADLKKRKYAMTEKPRAQEPAEPGTDRRADPRQRGRHVPAHVRRQVAERDGERCSYVDERGQRCRETSGLELHHEHAFALGGPATEANISLRCKAHNDLAAEHDFGRDFVERKKGAGGSAGSRDSGPALARHSWQSWTAGDAATVSACLAPPGCSRSSPR